MRLPKTWQHSVLTLYSELDEVSDGFPEEYFSAKVLPELLKSVEFGGGGARILTSVIKIGASLSDEQFGTKVTPVIIRLFANPDRAIRVCLLDNLPKIIERLAPKVVNDKIFPQMVCLNIDRHPAQALTDSGHWLLRCCTCCARANGQGRLDYRLQAI